MVHLFVHSFSRLFIHSVVHSSVHSFVHLFISLFLYLFVCSFLCLFVCPFVCLFVCLFVFYVCSFVHSGTYFLILGVLTSTALKNPSCRLLVMLAKITATLAMRQDHLLRWNDHQSSKSAIQDAIIDPWA